MIMDDDGVSKKNLQNERIFQKSNTQGGVLLREAFSTQLEAHWEDVLLHGLSTLILNTLKTSHIDTFAKGKN